MQETTRFGKVRMCARVFEVFVIIGTVYNSAAGNFNRLAFVGYIGIPLIIALIAVVALGRNYMIE